MRRASTEQQYALFHILTLFEHGTPDWLRREKQNLRRTRTERQYALLHIRNWATKKSLNTGFEEARWRQ